MGKNTFSQRAILRGRSFHLGATEMTIGAAQKAAIDHLEDFLASYSIGTEAEVFPNRADEKVVPRVEVFQGPVLNRMATLRGATDADPLIQIDVVVARNDGTGRQGQIVDAIVGLFKAGTKFPPAEVVDAPQIGGYRQDGAEYRASITVRYRTHITA